MAGKRSRGIERDQATRPAMTAGHHHQPWSLHPMRSALLSRTSWGVVRGQPAGLAAVLALLWLLAQLRRRPGSVLRGRGHAPLCRSRMVGRSRAVGGATPPLIRLVAGRPAHHYEAGLPGRSRGSRRWRICGG